MKKLFTILAVAATLVSCAKEDVVREAAREAIGFDNAFVENSTRSVNDPSWSNGKLFPNFAVYGYVENASLFNNVVVSGSALNGDWTYTNTQYWITGAKYNFAAIAPAANGADGVFTVAKSGDNYVGTTVLPFTNNGQNDLLYAQNPQYQAGDTGTNDKVEFSFRHALSKVKFSFENDYNATAATIKVHTIKIENAFATATATLGENSTAWANHAGTLVLDFGNASDDEATDAKESVEVAYADNYTYESLNERFLIPGAVPSVTIQENGANVTNVGYKVTFKVDLLVNGTTIKSYDHTAYANFIPEAGNAYDIKTIITASNIDPDNAQQAIEFTVTSIDGWDTDYNDGADGDNNINM